MKTGSAEAIAELLATARGARPPSLLCGEAEDALNVALALMIELVVANDRIDRLERRLAELAGQDLADFRDDFGPAEAAAERRDSNDALLMRTMRVFLDPRTAPAGQTLPG